MSPGVVIAHVSDLHLGAHAPGAADALVADVVAAAPALTVVTGDLTMRALPRQFRAAVDLLRRLPGPLLVVPGNHDVPLDPRRLRPAAAYRRHGPAPPVTVVEVPGVRALGLWSTPWWRWKGGYVSPPAAAHVEHVLGGAPPGDVRLLALHHPPSVHGLAALAGRGRLLDAVARARVDLVLAGHTHRPTARLLVVQGAAGAHGVVEVVAGTALSTRVRGTGRSWSLVRVDDAAVTVEERLATDSGWEPARLVRYRRARRPAGAGL